MRIIPLFLAVLLALPVSTGFAADSGDVRIRALLVVASPQRGASDPRLARYEPTLRRILRFEGYQLAGEGTAQLSGPGQASISLGQGHSLQLGADKSEGRGVKIRVRWDAGGQSLMNTGLALRPGVPAVLGGPSTGNEGEVWAVILIAE